MPTAKDQLRKHFLTACLRLLNEQNRDQFAPAYGCFDRRYWGWKLVDYPEATFQRAVYPLAWLLDQPHALPHDLLQQAIISGLQFSLDIQHRDGSFDQAFPNEHSFGATAFLLHPLLYAFQRVQSACDRRFQNALKGQLEQAASFLSDYNETHGHIANHLAGGALSLLYAADVFSNRLFQQRATQLIQNILDHQSNEGWFTEYEGADPGYQTLCMYYLVQCKAYLPNWLELDEALKRAVKFLQWFVHPDGTFAGEYGSRRTGVYYPGGIALLAETMPIAERMTQTMLREIAELKHLNAMTVDMGNLVPILSSWIPLINSEQDFDAAAHTGFEPQDPVEAVDFPEAGLHIRKNARYYAVIGSANGGVLKIFAKGKIIWDDSGYVGQLPNGTLLSTQIVDRQRTVTIQDNIIEIQAPFYTMANVTTSPLKFIILRLLNITLMQHIGLGNWVKAILVSILITGKQAHPLLLKRQITFKPDAILIADTIVAQEPIRLDFLSYGIPFVSIHMASARYLNLASAHNITRKTIKDITPLESGGRIHEETMIRL